MYDVLPSAAFWLTKAKFDMPLCTTSRAVVVTDNWSISAAAVCTSGLLALLYDHAAGGRRLGDVRQVVGSALADIGKRAIARLRDVRRGRTRLADQSAIGVARLADSGVAPEFAF